VTPPVVKLDFGGRTGDRLLAGFAVFVLGALVYDLRWNHPGGPAPILMGMGVTLVWLAVVGRRALRRADLIVDVARGTVTVVGPPVTKSCELERLGALEVVRCKRPDPRWWKVYGRDVWYELRAPGLGETCCAKNDYSRSLEAIRARFQPQLERLATLARIRRALVEPGPDDGAYRSPDVAIAVAEAEPDAARLDAALRELTGDPEGAVAHAATRVREALMAQRAHT
jgi:hypothetical protein